MGQGGEVREYEAGVIAMKFPRRAFLQAAMATAAAPVLSRRASALDYPSRPVRLVVGFPAGTSPDITARLVGQGLSDRLGQQIVIDNRPGAAGSLAVEIVATAPADGYTLLVALSSSVVNGALYTNQSFNIVRDIAPVAFIGGTPFVLVVTPSLPVKTLPEFIAYAKANPGKINMATQGVGTTPHVCGELLKMMTGITFTHVPYRAPLMPDLLAGQVQFYFSPMPQPVEYIKDGRLRALGVSTATRIAVLPDVPAIAEFVPGYKASGWLGVGAPKGAPAEVIEKLNREIGALVTDSEMKARLVGAGLEPRTMTPTEFGKFIADENEKWSQVIKFADIKPE
jgi:tripartite-type tricarboxylate transporter receptor subunit TctC